MPLGNCDDTLHIKSTSSLPLALQAMQLRDAVPDGCSVRVDGGSGRIMLEGAPDMPTVRDAVAQVSPYLFIKE